MTRLISKAIGPGTPFGPFSWEAAAIVRLAAGMLQHGHGGTLLIVPDSKPVDGLLSTERYAFNNDLSYPLRDALRQRVSTQQNEEGLTSMMSKLEADVQHERSEGAILALDELLRSVSKFTAVDGATLVTGSLRVVGFGFFVNMASEVSVDSRQVKFVSPTDVKSETRTTNIGDFRGGTRHRAALYFCARNRDALAFVASQDGVLSFFATVEEDNSILSIRPFNADIGAFRRAV
jgi:hypothetical protein